MHILLETLARALNWVSTDAWQPHFLARTSNLVHQVPEALRSLMEMNSEQRGTQSPMIEASESKPISNICADVYAPEIHDWVLMKALLKQTRGEVKASGAQLKL